MSGDKINIPTNEEGPLKVTRRGALITRDDNSVKITSIEQIIKEKEQALLEEDAKSRSRTPTPPPRKAPFQEQTEEYVDSNHLPRRPSGNTLPPLAKSPSETALPAENFTKLSPTPPRDKRRSSILGSTVQTEGRRSSLPLLANRPLTRDMAAMLDGIPPSMLLASQMSTKRWGNTISYRSSGPIPRGLYRQILLGRAAPKSFKLKIKSANWGVMEGYAAVHDKLNRVQRQANGAYEIRKQDPNDLPRDEQGEVKLNKFHVSMTLRDLFSELTREPAKYELVAGLNPDQEGILRFRQINHSSEYVESVIFSIDLTDKKAMRMADESYDLVASQLERFESKKQWQKPGYQPEGWDADLYGNFQEKLDYSFPCYAEIPGERERIKVEAYGDALVTVRDTDIDFISHPTSIAQVLGLTESNLNPAFFVPLDMTPSMYNTAYMYNIGKMLDALYDLNQLEWEHYFTKSEKLICELEERGQVVDEAKLATMMPLVPKFNSPGELSQYVIAVGKGTPMELYQALEINLINQKILNIKNEQPTLDLDDFIHPGTAANAYYLLQKQPIELDENTLDRFFIQHPAECHNTKYTCDRGASVLVHQASIALPKNDLEVTKYLNGTAKGEKLSVNPEWLGEKPGANSQGAIWAEYCMQRPVDDKLKKALDSFLEHHPGFIHDKLTDGADPAVKRYLDNFLEHRPDMQILLSSYISQQKTAEPMRFNR